MGRSRKPAKSREAKFPLARKSPEGDGARVRDLEKRLAEALKRESEAQGQLQTRNRELVEAHEQQTATSEILRVISSSPTDVQPVFDAIVKNAVELCGGVLGTVFRFDGEPAAPRRPLQCHHGGYPSIPRRLSDARQSGHRCWVLDSRLPSYSDARFAADGTVPWRSAAMARAAGFRGVVAVPMLRGRAPIGLIAVGRRESGLFSDREIALLQTFAEQAVIAIENVRLFTELQEKNAALTQAHAQVAESLEQQTAASEILRVISSSPTDIQPVFDAIVARATTLCGALFSALFRFDGELLHFVAHHNFPAEAVEAFTRDFPTRLEGTTTARAILERRVVNVADVLADPTQSAKALARAQALGYRSILAVPMFREGQAIGTIAVVRPQVGGFTDKQVELLKTFADQAVIAIENVRLFTELQSSNRELTRALDTQTATSDILRVISRSQTDLQPVFDTILTSAVRLLRGHSGVLTRLAGDQIELAAHTSVDDAGDASLRAIFPQSLHSELPHAQAIHQRAPINTGDTQSDPGIPEPVRASARARGYHSWVTVPMLRQDEAVGTIAVTRSEAGGFTDEEIALLQTFADQAVIAIENARLLNELQARTDALTRSVDQLTALGEVGRAVSSTLDLETVLTTIVSRAVELSRADGGSMYEYDETAEEFSLRASYRLDDPDLALRREIRIRKGEGAAGQLAVSREPVQIPDITMQGAYDSRLRSALLRAGARAVLAVPLLHEEHLIGGLVVSRNAAGEFPSEAVELLRTFAAQSALAIQNARLFQELEVKSQLLEAASQHKSEFLANMSHELRTPLNAIIGFSEVLTDRMFGELNEKQEEYLKDIYASGTHLLSLINDILDLSKIEAGRMELELTDFHLPTALDNALMLVRERAGRRSITLQMSVDERLGEVQADERKIRQVVLNLLSNAIKFTPEGGRIEVNAVPVDALVEVSVSDTGVGIAPGDQEAVFEEFRQVGTAEKKAEGTGLGLTLCRKFIELHGGRIFVRSQVGVGSTFTFSLPVRCGE